MYRASRLFSCQYLHKINFLEGVCPEGRTPSLLVIIFAQLLNLPCQKLRLDAIKVTKFKEYVFVIVEWVGFYRVLSRK